MHILFAASSAGYAVDQVVGVAGHFVFRAVFSASNGCHDMAFLIEQGMIPAPVVSACCGNPLGWFLDLQDGGQL